jgi:hypothetical protein
MKSLLQAASLATAGNMDSLAGSLPLQDRLDDKVFNMMDNTTGLNLDFMSYAAYAQVGFNAEALLDAEILLRTSQKVFSTFFQHFVGNNMTHIDGGYVYQPLGLSLKTGPLVPNSTVQLTPDGVVAPKFEDVSRNTSQTATVTLSTRVEVLQINPVALWICISILAWLIITIIILAAVQRRQYGGMMRNIECIADVLVLIAGSERLLAVVEEKGIDTILEEDNIFTRLGWFRDSDGMPRWRIELVKDTQTQAQPIRLGAGYERVPESS